MAFQINLGVAQFARGACTELQAFHIVRQRKVGSRGGTLSAYDAYGENGEVVQLYVRDKNGTPERPSKELRGFAKVLLEPGECKTVTLTLAARDLSYYEERLHDWFAPSGVYEVMVGRASDDIRLTAELSFTTEKQIPFVVTLTTTLGELLTCPKTAPTIMQLLAPLAQSAGTDGLDEGLMNMMKKMIMEMPLKSLVSVMPGDQIELLIQQMNLLLAQ